MIRMFLILGWLSVLLLVEQAHADLEQFPERSLEWLTDTSDVIAVAVVEGSGKRESLRLELLLKPTDKDERHSWPVEIGTLTYLGFSPYLSYAPKRTPGDRLLLFARRTKDKQPKVHDIVYLNAAKIRPPPSGSWKSACAAIWKRAKKDRVCAVFNQHGEILVDPDYVLNCVKQRIKEGSRVPADAEIEKLESFRFTQAYGGYYVAAMPLPDNPSWADARGGSEVYFILVPPDLEHQSAAYAALTDNYDNLVIAKIALDRLSNFPHDPNVISWLETYLHEDHAAKYEPRMSEGKLLANELRDAVKETIEKLKTRANSPQESATKDQSQ